jgi:hypothetical protein
MELLTALDGAFGAKERLPGDSDKLWFVVFSTRLKSIKTKFQ